MQHFRLNYFKGQINCEIYLEGFLDGLSLELHGRCDEAALRAPRLTQLQEKKYLYTKIDIDSCKEYSLGAEHCCGASFKEYSLGAAWSATAE